MVLYQMECKCHKIILCSLVMLVAYNHRFHLVALGAWLGTFRGWLQVYSLCAILQYIILPNYKVLGSMGSSHTKVESLQWVLNSI